VNLTKERMDPPPKTRWLYRWGKRKPQPGWHPLAMTLRIISMLVWRKSKSWKMLEIYIHIYSFLFPLFWSG
jgi:hypothetical protein